MNENRLNTLEKLCAQLIEDETEETADEITKVIADLIIEEEEILIDGVEMEDGSVDPAHLYVDMDERYYFHVFTSMEKFRFCRAAHPFVLTLHSLMEPIFAEDSFGGIAINHKKGDPMVLISKEQIYEELMRRASVQD